MLSAAKSMILLILHKVDSTGIDPLIFINGSDCVRKTDRPDNRNGFYLCNPMIFNTLRLETLT
jgi:hypothetical protein